MVPIRSPGWIFLVFFLTIASFANLPSSMKLQDEAFDIPAFQDASVQLRRTLFGNELCRILAKFFPDNAVISELSQFVTQNSLQAGHLFVFITALMHAFAVPKWVVNAWYNTESSKDSNIFYPFWIQETSMSAFFPFYSAVLCLIIGRVIGTALAFAASSLFLAKSFAEEERDRLEYFQTLTRKYEEAGNAIPFITRLQMNGDQLFPSSFVNYAAPLAMVPVEHLVLGSAIASLPHACMTVTNSRLGPIFYYFQGFQALDETHWQTIFIAGVLYYVPDVLCKALTKEFSNDLKTTKSWARKLSGLPHLGQSSLNSASNRKAAHAVASCGPVTVLSKAGSLVCAVASKLDPRAALAMPSWAPSLSVSAMIMHALGEDSDSDGEYGLEEIDGALKSLAQTNEQLPGDHRHLLFQDIDPAYDGKYCPDFQNSDMRDSVTLVTPYSVVDKANSMGIPLEADDEEDEVQVSSGMDVPDWRDEDYFCQEQPKQYVRIYTEDDEVDASKPDWQNDNWKKEYIMNSKSSCPYVNNMKIKLQQQQQGGKKMMVKTGIYTNSGPKAGRVRLKPFLIS